jgi:hypothetical protein
MLLMKILSFAVKKKKSKRFWKKNLHCFYATKRQSLTNTKIIVTHFFEALIVVDKAMLFLRRKKSVSFEIF